ncbi:glycoside hydrolase domain-containing protein [Paenibacillus shenyangensis]|uniref:glycoside hydrolase domain-containing protein n=1 Tax=Paenibacillus sp. A9 TaxID=1284352 RepID=UPI000364640B|nr:glycoside hydrolase domain-containing protein [Paenibacillus sp. A9]
MAYYGFDKRDYVGATNMQKIYALGKFSYSGFYLTSPHYGGTGYTSAARQTIANLGMGFMIYYVGRQTTDSATLKTSAQGAKDATDAIAKAKAVGFRGGIIYLDVEGDVKADRGMDNYILGFYGGLEDSAFTAGIYCSSTSASHIYNLFNGRTRPRFIIARYDPAVANKYSGLTPTGSGHSFATTWQYQENAVVAVQGYNLLLDLNVSDYKDPSAVGF